MFLLLVAVKKQVLLYVPGTAGAEIFSFDQQVVAAAGCAHGRWCCVRIPEDATLILTQDFLGRREITSIRTGNRVFDTVTRLLAADPSGRAV